MKSLPNPLDGADFHVLIFDLLLLGRFFHVLQPILDLHQLAVDFVDGSRIFLDEAVTGRHWLFRHVE